MEKLSFNGTWEEVKEHLMDKYPSLTQSDFKNSKGKTDKLLNHLAQKTGCTTREMRTIIRKI